MILTPKNRIKEYTDNGWWNSDTLYTLFLDACEEAGNKEALLDPPNRNEFTIGDPRRLTFNDVKKEVDRFSSKFFDLGFRKDDKVILQLPNIVELAILYIALSKIGVKYKHFFIDEFQDTSKLQWTNLVPLIENSLSSEDSSLSISGDIKQAIYRWRGGDPEQLLKLCNNNTDFFTKSKVINLETNYRSKDEIIKFNNSLFNHISQFVFTSEDHKKIYKTCQQEYNNNLGGYVGVNILDNLDSSPKKENAYNLKIQQIVEDSLKNNFELRDICILVRTNDQGVRISDFLNKKNIDIVSSETLLISKSEDVEFIIAILKFSSQPKLINSKLNIINYLHSKKNL